MKVKLTAKQQLEKFREKNLAAQSRFIRNHKQLVFHIINETSVEVTRPYTTKNSGIILTPGIYKKI
jgi:hypothetical protein